MIDESAVALLSSEPVDDRTDAPAQRRGRARAARTRHRVVLTAHVLTSAGWFGAAVVVAVLLGVAASSGAVASHALSRALQTTIWVTVSFGAAAVATGVVLGLVTKWGVVRYRWVVAKELLALAVIVTDLALLGPSVADGADGRLAGPHLQPAIAHCVVLTVATVLSVFKPGGRTALGRRRVPSRG
jgi:ABC-type Fe3+ transport system permease subunit